MSSMRVIICLLAIVIAWLCPASLYAALSFTLAESNGADLDNLSVGQTVEIDVVLGGLEVGEELGYLAGTLTFDSGFLGTAFDVSPGGIISDSDGFIGFGAPGLADGFYDYLFTLSGDTIDSNGVFFSFKLTIQNAGSGVVAIDEAMLAARDLFDEPIAIAAGDPLSLRTVSTDVVPEPATWPIFFSGLFWLLGWVGLHRHSQYSPSGV
jgi:hypothetical protein